MLLNRLLCGSLLFASACSSSEPELKNVSIVAVNPELQSTKEIIRRQFTVKSTSSWRYDGTDLGVLRFNRNVSIADPRTSSVETIHQTAYLVKGSHAQAREYATTIGSINRGFAKLETVSRDPQLDAVDAGGNVFSIRVIGSPKNALQCEVSGFHTPNLGARCGWQGRDNFVVVDTDVRVLVNLVNKLEVVMLQVERLGGE